MDSSESVNLLEAQGQLNKNIQNALQQFRQKVVVAGTVPARQKNIIRHYQSHKEGPEKVFVFRESLMTLMFEINDFRTIYNMVAASFICLTFSLFYDRYVETGQIVDVLKLLRFFRGGTTVIVAWMCLAINFYSILLVTKVAIAVSWMVWLPLYMVQISMGFMIATYFATSDDLGFSSVIIIMAQMIRMFMKSHSYLRNKLLYCTENKYKNMEFKGIRVINGIAQNGKDKDQKNKNVYINIKNQDLFSQIQKISYFFFCPTLIYRDHYTLTPVRSFKRIIVHSINALACTYYAFILHENMCRPAIEQLEKSLTYATLASTVIHLMLPSVLFLILGFFGFLHSWLNLWSEITRFPDRAFYSDWWNSVQFGSYYRKWNMVVHDWLYYYIYLDLYRFFPKLKGVRSMAQLITFAISAIIHEWIIYYAIGFFYPILFILFAGPGIIFVQWSFLRARSVNLIFWLEMYIGTAMLFTFYLIECFARAKVDTAMVEQEWGKFEFFIPRTFYLGQT